MKRLLVLLAIVTLYACSRGNGELIGVQDRGEWFQPDPFGMLFIPMGSYQMGPSDQDVPYALTAQSKTVSVQAFYMDQTEISNNEYRQFVYWVRDSLARRMMGEEYEEEFLITMNEFDEEIDPPRLDWWAKLKWNTTENREILEPLFYTPNERYYNRREIDTRKLNYEYYWIDYRRAASRNSRDSKDHAFSMDRSSFLMKDVINVYPDTLAWIHDFTYS